MAQKVQLTIYPTGGSNVKTTASGVDLIRPLDTTLTRVQTSDVGGYNWDNTTIEGETRKCIGHSTWDATETFTGLWQAFLLVNDGTNQTMSGVNKGLFYTFNPSGASTNINATSPVTFTTTGPISLIQYGAYAVISSLATEPYKWMYGDANLTKLIQTGTAYKFKYMEKFNNHLIGAYSDQTNGNIELRWTDALPSFASFTFPASNQLYKPDSDVGITGIKTLGNMYCLVYGKNSIHNLVYDANSSVVFSMVPITSNVGTASGFSIVDTGRSHAFFDSNRGFVELAGASSWSVISDAITPWVSTITRNSYSKIVGALTISANEIVWAVPTNGSTEPDTLFYYNIVKKSWRREYRGATALGYFDFQTYNPMSWTGLASASPNDPEWPSSGTWESYVTNYVGNFLFGDSTTGLPCWVLGDDFNGAAFTSWRIEPVFGYPDTTRHKRWQEVHFGISETGNFSIDLEWRTGETEQECKSSPWEVIGSVDCGLGDVSAIYPDKVGRYHQFRWGTSGAGENFKVTTITLKGFYV